MPHSRNCCAGPRPVAAVLLSNLYLIYVLDLWFEWWSSPRLRGEAYLLGYIDDFVLCFRNRRDALRVQDVLCERLATFWSRQRPGSSRLVDLPGRMRAIGERVFEARYRQANATTSTITGTTMTSIKRVASTMSERSSSPIGP
jgi:hypothetical protein